MALLGLLVVAAPAAAQSIAAADEAAYQKQSKAQWIALKAFVAAAKDGREAGELMTDKPVYIGPHREFAALAPSAISAWSRACEPVYVVNPEIIGGRPAIPRDKMQLLWTCPAEGTVKSGISVVEFEGDRIALLRSYLSDDAPAIVAVREKP